MNSSNTQPLRNFQSCLTSTLNFHTYSYLYPNGKTIKAVYPVLHIQKDESDENDPDMSERYYGDFKNNESDSYKVSIFLDDHLVLTRARNSYRTIQKGFVIFPFCYNEKLYFLFNRAYQVMELYCFHSDNTCTFIKNVGLPVEMIDYIHIVNDGKFAVVEGWIWHPIALKIVMPVNEFVDNDDEDDEDNGEGRMEFDFFCSFYWENEDLLTMDDNNVEWRGENSGVFSWKEILSKKISFRSI